MQQEPEVTEKIDDEDIAALADMINSTFPDDSEEDAVVVADDDIVVSDVDHMRLVEAILFASPEPLTVNVIRERMPDGADVGGLLMELQKTYEGRGVSLLNMEGHWAFRTAIDLGDALSMKKDIQRKLSKAAMETMAIVAYHQPVTRPEIENIRGVAISNGTIDVLMDCGWVKPGRRRETPGRPLTWVTTPAFLDHFGLIAITDLPGMDELKASGLLDSRPAIAITTGNLFGVEDEMLADDLQESDIDDEEDDDAFEATDDVAVKVEKVTDIAADGEAWDDLEASNDDDDDEASDDEEEVA